MSDKNFVKEHLAVDENAPVCICLKFHFLFQFFFSFFKHSSGRGGLGNINRSRSRDPHDTPLVHSSGRGGVGNIHSGAQLSAAIDEEERKKIGKINNDM